MRWPWQRRTVPTDMRAHAAVVDAEKKLTAQRQLQTEVDRVANRLEERRHQNRFAEMIEEAIQLRRHA